VLFGNWVLDDGCCDHIRIGPVADDYHDDGDDEGRPILSEFYVAEAKLHAIIYLEPCVERAAEEKRLSEQGIPGDVDFQRMIRQYRQDKGPIKRIHLPPGDLKICICVRKRPINERERRLKDYDSVTCVNPVVMVHDCKLRVDGITKYLDNTDFMFDHTFGEEDTTEELYKYTTAPLIPFIFQQGRATCFAYGQTGSGGYYFYHNFFFFFFSSSSSSSSSSSYCTWCLQCPSPPHGLLL